MPRPFLILPILLLVSLAVAACAPAATPIAVQPVETEASIPAEPTLVPSAPAAPTSPPDAAPTEAVFVGAGGQFATDPSTVELAAGRPTLVKFFAFW
ncbi:MAG: hypothetical protein HW404_1134 [Anaerolineales bacterium]|nr:hypothetical protein [Anaerolineales bacterium]